MTLSLSALHVSAERGRWEVMQVLLNNGSDVMATDHLGNTALHYCGHLETVECLVQYGCNVNHRLVSQLRSPPKEMQHLVQWTK